MITDVMICIFMDFDQISSTAILKKFPRVTLILTCLNQGHIIAVFNLYAKVCSRSHLGLQTQHFAQV